MKVNDKSLWARYAPTGNRGCRRICRREWRMNGEGFGIASELMHFVITAAAVAGIKCLEGLVLRENAAMLSLAQKLGFEQTSSEDGRPLSGARLQAPRGAMS